MAERPLAAERDLVRTLVGEHAPEEWDRTGELPPELLRKLGASGLLCAEVSSSYGGLGVSSLAGGELTAYVGGICSSLRSVMTSQGMAAWAIQRLGDVGQQARYLPELTSGKIAAVGFSEPGAGSDLSLMTTTIRAEGDTVVVDGEKKWVTAARYADLLLIVGRYEEGAAAVVVPTATPGLHIDRVGAPLGCKAAGHANVRVDSVRLPASSVLGGVAQSLSMLVTTALAYGRISVAWGCAGILRACLSAAAGHAKTRRQFGKPLSEHQLVARHLAELLVAEQIVTRACEHASRCWDDRSPDLVVATVLAKYVGAVQAADGASRAVQVLASAGAQDGHTVARAYRDAKMMELIEGSNEICQLILAEQAVR